MHAVPLHADKLFFKLREAIATKTIRLPTLPEVALRVKKAVEQESSAQEIAALVEQDIALTGRLVQVANSPLYRGAAKVESVQIAVTRLGTKLVRNLVVGLALRQMFKTQSAVLNQCFHDVWNDSIHVAAMSQALASGEPGIDRDEALLGGLLHNIGALPILDLLGETKTTALDQRKVQFLIDELAPTLGTEILTSWQLPEELASVPAGCRDFNRKSGKDVDYVDIVTAARIEHLVCTGRLELSQQHANLPVFEKLGINVEEVVLEDEGTAAWAKGFDEALGA